MGRINISYLYKNLKHQILKLIPYKYRRPVILVGSIFGLIAYYHFMVNLSWVIFRESNKYLLMIKSFLLYIVDLLNQTYFAKEAYVFLFLCVIYIIFRYCKPDKNENDDKNITKNIYNDINFIISVMYIIITVLTFLPFF